MARGLQRLLSIVLLLQAGAWAADIDVVSVERDGDRYRVDMQVRLEADAVLARDLMRDASRLPEINDNIVSAMVPADGHLHTVVEFCVTFFCRRVEQLQTVEAGKPATLKMTVLPESSDLTYGEATWDFRALDADRSYMRFNAEIVPDFWVPPVIGPWLIRRKMLEQARVTAAGIEQVAAELRSGPVGPDSAP
jgi:hypothetical protein